MLFLKTLVLSFSLEAGLMPGHEVSLFTVPEGKSSINSEHTTYSDLKFKLDIGKYFYAFGGATSYQWPVRDQINFYPFRMDCIAGVGFKYKAFEAGWIRECFHPVMPNADLIEISHGLPFGKIDSGDSRFFVKVECSKQLF